MGKDITPIQQRDEALASVANLTTETATLKTTIATLTGERDTAQSALVTANAALATEKTAHSTDTVALADITAKFTAEKTGHDLLKANFETELQKRVSAEAARIVAGQGIPPLKTEVNDKPADTAPKAAALTGMDRLAKACEERLKIIG